MQKSLQKMTWGEIAEISKSGKAADTFEVGDEKVIKLANGEHVTLVIAGFNHDERPDGKTAGITFATKNLLEFEYPMNSEWTNKGGWEWSRMRHIYLRRIEKMLPKQLQDLILHVEKPTNCDGAILNSKDRLFLFSEVEVSGNSGYSLKGEGRQYDYFKDPSTRSKSRDGHFTWWYTRSPTATWDSDFAIFDTTGNASNGRAAGANGVCLGFCV